MRGYKVFNPDFTCLGFQFEEGKEYTHEGSIKICHSGFHFCQKTNDCFNYYSFDAKNIVCEVEALGEVHTKEGDSKACTNIIKIVRRLSWIEVLDLVNTGTGNSGRGNAGNYNAGNDNAGYRNAGNANAGNDNAGAFCTCQPKYKLFNKESDWTHEQFIESDAFCLLDTVCTTQWIPSYNMSEEEKAAHPYHVTTEGYSKQIPFKEAFQNSWHNWNKSSRAAFESLPNFDPDIFFEITGVKITATKTK